MSYIKVRSISISKSGKVKLCSAESNIRPIYYSKHEYQAKDIKSEVVRIVGDFISGNLRFHTEKTSNRLYKTYQLLRYCSEFKGRAREAFTDYYYGSPDFYDNVCKFRKTEYFENLVWEAYNYEPKKEGHIVVSFTDSLQVHNEKRNVYQRLVNNSFIVTDTKSRFMREWIYPSKEEAEISIGNYAENKTPVKLEKIGKYFVLFLNEDKKLYEHLKTLNKNRLYLYSKKDRTKYPGSRFYIDYNLFSEDEAVENVKNQLN